MNYETVNVLDHGYVSLIASMGTDFDIVAAARVSLLESSKGEEADLKLLKYLYNNKHTSPFEMVQFKFRVCAPIVVIRQWHKHRTWSYNEQSGRYMVFNEIKRYTPKVYRLQDPKNKQSSIGEIELPSDLVSKRDLIRRLSNELYEDMLNIGISREMARLEFSLSTYSTFIARVDGNNLINFLRLRLHDGAQYEIRIYAKALMELAATQIPHTISLFREEIQNNTNYNWINKNV